MSTNTVSTQETTEAQTSKPKRKQSSNKSKPAKKTQRKKPTGQPKAERVNKKAEVVALMKRAMGASLAEIMAATGWQAHTVRGFVSILGSNGEEKIESSKNDAGERTYRMAK